MFIQPGYAANDIPTILDLENASYTGMETVPVTLVNGRWEGEAYLSDGTSKPSIGLFKDIYITGDLNADGKQEALAALWQNTGGSGQHIYIAVMSYQNGDVKNIATALIGDRVKIRTGTIDSGKIILGILQAGENDAMCCPTKLTNRTWALVEGQLKEDLTSQP